MVVFQNASCFATGCRRIRLDAEGLKALQDRCAAVRRHHEKHIALSF
jgi:hypothetical protein